MANGSDFLRDLQAWSNNDKDRITQLARQSVLELAYRMINNSMPPVGPNVITGLFSGSWYPSLNAPPPLDRGGQDAESIDKDKDAELQIVVSTLEVGDTFYFYNGAEYGPRLNWGFTGADSLGRHYNQKGLFFLEKTIAQWSAIVAETAADLRFTR